MKKEKKMKVILVDDNKNFVEAVKSIFLLRDDLEVIGEAYDGKEFLELISQYDADLVLMDINMPKMDGIEAIKRSLIHNSALRFIGVTMLDNVEAHLEMLNNGFSAGILKNKFTRQFEEALDAIKKGRNYFPILN